MPLTLSRESSNFKNEIKNIRHRITQQVNVELLPLKNYKQLCHHKNQRRSYFKDQNEHASPHEPCQLIRMRFPREQLDMRRWHSLVYETPSLPQTGIEVLSHISRHLHVAVCVRSSTLHSPPNAQNFWLHDSEQENHQTIKYQTAAKLSAWDIAVHNVERLPSIHEIEQESASVLFFINSDANESLAENDGPYVSSYQSLQICCNIFLSESIVRIARRTTS